MNTTQLVLAITVPTVAVMLGTLTNALVFQSLSARINSLESRIDMIMSKLMEIDTRLSRVEERLEHR
jgi:hypothetical protein